MTCIVGYLDIQNACSWIGADSLGSSSAHKATYLSPKVFKNILFKNVLMGATGSFRHIDLLKYSENLFDELDLYKETELDHKYIVTKLIPKVITLFQDNIKDEADASKGTNIIVCSPKSVFEVQSDYSVLEPSFGFCSVGSGMQYALGSLYSTKDLDTPVPRKIEVALESAEQCGCGVQRPFTILNTKNEDVITIT
jgi:ATP-dependent protease HslVU (ClpYQ) peptidase subunit